VKVLVHQRRVTLEGSLEWNYQREGIEQAVRRLRGDIEHGWERIMEPDISVFADRKAAGLALAHAMRRIKLRRPLIVLGLPRGGVPVAYEVARALRAPLDVMVVRKVGMPGQPELAIGAIASGGITLREPRIAAHLVELNVPFEQLAQAEHAELQRRESAYRADAPPLDLRGQTAVLVDDGLATGATMLAAVRAARKAGARSVVVAAPVASDEAAALIGGEADEIVILKTPAYLVAIGQWYENFEQVQDAEVRTLLGRMRQSSRDASRVRRGGPG
jgi:predicted phosphoribosyltransferase